MTEKERYETILAVMADKIKEQEGTITLLAWQVDDLKTKLAEAEQHTKPSAAQTKIEIR
jgi:FtsZ-binding cell division protein ZapB